MKTKKKILFVGPLPPPLGGVAVINQSFQSLEYNGYDNLGFNTSNNQKREDLYKGLPWQNLPKELRKIADLKRYIEQHQPAIANVFVTSGYSIVRDIYYLRLLHKHKIPIIVHFHSKKTGEFALKVKRIKKIGRLFKKYASKIVLLSKDHYEYFVQFFDINQCEVIENFVDYNAFDNQIKDKTNEFLYVGRLSVEKGFFDLLKACAILKQRHLQFKINVLGAAPTLALQTEIEGFIKSHQLEITVSFHGLKYEEEKYQLFKRSKILVFPSHFENSPVVLKEAIAAKMAILSSNIEANENVLQKRENYISFEKGKAEDLALKIIELISNPKQLLKMCEASSLIKDYDISVAQNKLTKLFNELVIKHEK